MIFPRRLSADQLKRGYKAPKAERGVRTKHADGRLETRASFSTSNKRQEARREQRPDNTENSIGWASSVTNTDPPKPNPKSSFKNSAPNGIQPHPGQIGYTRPYSLMPDSEKAAQKGAQASDPDLQPKVYKRDKAPAKNTQGWTYSAHSVPPNQKIDLPPLTDRQKRLLKGR